MASDNIHFVLQSTIVDLTLQLVGCVWAQKEDRFLGNLNFLQFLREESCSP